MAKGKPEEMSVAEYNELLMKDALFMLQCATADVQEIKNLVAAMGKAAQFASENIDGAVEKIEQLRLDI